MVKVDKVAFDITEISKFIRVTPSLMNEILSATEAPADAAQPLKEVWVVKGIVTSPDAYEGHAVMGQTEWQFSDGPPGERGGSSDYLDLEAGIKAHAPAIFHFVDDPSHSNWKRAERALAALTAWRVASGDEGDTFDASTVADLLADLMHACRLNRDLNGSEVDFAACLKRAVDNFEEEADTDAD